MNEMGGNERSLNGHFDSHLHHQIESPSLPVHWAAACFCTESSRSTRARTLPPSVAIVHARLAEQPDRTHHHYQRAESSSTPGERPRSNKRRDDEQRSRAVVMKMGAWLFALELTRATSDWIAWAWSVFFVIIIIFITAILGPQRILLNWTRDFRAQQQKSAAHSAALVGTADCIAFVLHSCRIRIAFSLWGRLFIYYRRCCRLTVDRECKAHAQFDR